MALAGSLWGFIPMFNSGLQRFHKFVLKQHYPNAVQIEYQRRSWFSFGLESKLSPFLYCQTAVEVSSDSLPLRSNIFIYADICVCVYIYTYTYICMYACMYIMYPSTYQQHPINI